MWIIRRKAHTHTGTLSPGCLTHTHRKLTYTYRDTFLTVKFLLIKSLDNCRRRKINFCFFPNLLPHKLSFTSKLHALASLSNNYAKIHYISVDFVRLLLTQRTQQGCWPAFTGKMHGSGSSPVKSMQGNYVGWTETKRSFRYSEKTLWTMNLTRHLIHSLSFIATLTKWLEMSWPHTCCGLANNKSTFACQDRD